MTKRTKPDDPAASPPDGAALASRHVRVGWWLLLVFTVMGLVLESLHGFKVGFYLDLTNETRRLMWTLAHAHGTLLALISIVFGLTVERFSAARAEVASRCLLGACVLLPAGFLLGGVITYDGDPGLAILLVPIGAALLIAGVLITALGLRRRDG